MQSITVQGQVKEFNTKNVLPFAHIVLNNGENTFFADIDGKFQFEVPVSQLKKLRIKCPFFKSQKFDFNPDTISNNLVLNVSLIKSAYFFAPETTDSVSYKFIQKLIDYLPTYNPSINNQYSSKIYHKFNIYSKENKDNQPFTDFLHRLILGKNSKEVHSHDVFLMETISEKRFASAYNQKQMVTAYKVSGLEDPSFVALSEQIDLSTIFDAYFTIAKSKYINPLQQGTFKRYHFEILDTLNQDAQHKTIIVKFGQKKQKNFNGINGLLYIQYPEMCVKQMVAWPNYDSKLEKKIYQNYDLSANNKLYLSATNLNLKVGNIGIQDISLYLSSVFRIYDINDAKFDTTLNKNEYIIEQLSTQNNQSENYWIQNRKIPFTSNDSATYSVFENIRKKKTVDQIVNIGKNLYWGEIAFKKINLELNKTLNFNNYEKFRTGFGFNTSDQFSNKWKYGLYTCYGSKDGKWKYGASVTYFMNRLKERSVNFTFHNDLSNAGETKFAFSNYMYSDERLTKYRILIKDKEMGGAINVSIKPFIYTNMQFGLALNEKNPTYQYAYLPSPNKTFFTYLESYMSVRYSFRELWARSDFNKLAIESKYPIAYFKITRGVKSWLGEYEYWKSDLRIDQTIRTLNFGFSTIQLKAGLTSANLPYHQLYNLYGTDNKDANVTIHNHFVTMAYNEFVANKYAAIFFTHNFGRFYVKNRFFNPIIEYAFNYGIGDLQNASNQLFVSTKTINKGYYESGLNMNNIINLNLTGLKIGLGFGFYYRFGPYAYASNSKNFVVKLGTNFYF